MSSLAKAMRWTREPKLSATKWPAIVLAAFRAVQSQAQAAVGAFDDLAAHKAHLNVKQHSIWPETINLGDQHGGPAFWAFPSNH
jgi:hypothetical protein